MDKKLNVQAFSSDEYLLFQYSCCIVLYSLFYTTNYDCVFNDDISV